MFRPPRGKSVNPRTPPSGQTGAALVNTLLALVVLSSMTALLYSQLSELRTALGAWTWKIKAEAAAESAVAEASLKLIDDPAWRAGEDTWPEFQSRVGDAQARLTTRHIRPPDLVEMTAVGRHRQGRSRAIRRIRILDPTLFALIARRRAALEFGVTLDGPAAAGEEIRLGRGIRAAPNSGGVSLVSGRRISVTGSDPAFNLFESADPMPVVPVLELDRLKSAYAARIANSTLTDVNISGRNILRDGSLTLVGGKFSDISIYVAGDLRLMGAPEIIARGDTPVLIVEKDLIANFSGADIRGVIYVGGKATLRGQSVITGTLIAEEIDIADGVTVRAFNRDASRPRIERGFFTREISIGVP